MRNEQNPPNLDEWFGLSAIEIQKSSQGWNALELQIAKLYPCSENILGPLSENLTINMALKGKTRMQARFKEYRIEAADELYVPGMMNLVPSMLQTDGLWDSHFLAGFWSFSKQAFDALASDVAYGDPMQITLRPKFHFHDPLLYQLLMGIAKELEDGDYLGELYVDSLAHAVMIHLLKFYTNTPKPLVSQKGKLSFEEKHRLEDYIEANLHKKMSIAELASLLYVSVPHLERCFRASYGMPVYRYLSQRRIERAKILLLDKNRSLLDVALDCGFANQSHFNHQFKQIVGMTPTEFSRHA